MDSGAVSIIRKMAENARLDGEAETAVITLRVKRKDWPERLLCGDDVDFNTAVLEKGLANEEERVEARFKANIQYLESELEKTRQDAKDAYKNGFDAAEKRWSAMSQGKRGEVMVDNVFETFFPDIDPSDVSGKKKTMDRVYPINGVDFRVEVKNRDDVDPKYLTTFRAQVAELKAEAGIFISIRESRSMKLKMKDPLVIEANPVPVVFINGLETNPDMVRYAVDVLTQLVTARRRGDFSTSAAEEALGIINSSHQKALTEARRALKTAWNQINMCEVIVLKDLASVLEIRHGRSVNTDPIDKGERNSLGKRKRA